MLGHGGKDCAAQDLLPTTDRESMIYCNNNISDDGETLDFIGLAQSSRIGTCWFRGVDVALT